MPHAAEVQSQPLAWLGNFLVLSIFSSDISSDIANWLEFICRKVLFLTFSILADHVTYCLPVSNGFFVDSLGFAFYVIFEFSFLAYKT